MLVFCTFFGLFDPRATGASQGLQEPYLRHWWQYIIGSGRIGYFSDGSGWYCWRI